MGSSSESRDKPSEGQIRLRGIASDRKSLKPEPRRPNKMKNANLEHGSENPDGEALRYADNDVEMRDAVEASDSSPQVNRGSEQGTRRSPERETGREHEAEKITHSSGNHDLEQSEATPAPHQHSERDARSHDEVSRLDTDQKLLAPTPAETSFATKAITYISGKTYGQHAQMSTESSTAKIRRLERSLKELDDQRMIAASESSRFQTNYKNMWRDLQRKEMELENAVRQCSRLAEQNASLFRTQQTQEAQVRMAQEVMLKKGSQIGHGLAEEDKTIRHNFKRLQNAIKTWGKDWANKDITIIANWPEADHRKSLYDALAKVIRIDGNELPQGLKSTASMVSRSPAMCLSALVSSGICEQIFDSPFLPLRIYKIDEKKTETHPSSGTNRTFVDVYHELLACDTKKAQIWRCQTLEILDPSIGDGEAEILARKNAKALRLEVARKFAEDFLGGPAGALLARTNSKENLSRRGDELEDIFLQALDISARVWKQPIVLKCKQFKDFEDEKFVSDSEIMDAHPLHQLGFSEDGEEEDETRLDGHRILMVVSPAILAIGGSDGDDYQNYRVWAKAVVWLEE